MKYFICLILLLFSGGVCFAAEEKNTVRVGISNSAFSTYEHKSAEFILNGNSTVTDLSSSDLHIELGASTSLQVNYENGYFTLNIGEDTEIKKTQGPIIIASDNKITVKNLIRKGANAQYRGMIELRGVSDSKFNIINILDMQSYLKGVVPNEMPVSFGMEALKAQSVAARNYAVREQANYKNYDVCDSTACQVYFGAGSETALSNKAVDETLNIYAKYDNDAILALYSSTASGITENYKETFGNGIEDKPYLKSVKDNKSVDIPKKEDDIKKFFEKDIASFDMKSPRHRWVKEFDRFELEDILAKTLPVESKRGNVTPMFNEKEGFYGLEDIRVIKRGESPKALAVEIKSVSGDYVVSKELPIRRIFAKNGQILNSANFCTEKEYDKTKDEEKGEIKLLDKIDTSSPKRINRTKLGKKLPSKFKFTGAGFGHGVGMSQYGAGYLSSYGVSYQNILKHYYSGIEIGTLPKKVSYNPVSTNYVQEFYFSSKKPKGTFENPSKSPLKNEINELLNKNTKNHCILTIINKNNISDIEFYINDYRFTPEIKGFKKVITSDITEYLKEGINKITFYPLSEKDKKKSLEFYITTEEVKK